MKCRVFISIAIWVYSHSLYAQTELDSLLMDDDIDFSILSEDSLLLNELDSLSIFALLDSILSTDYRKSQLAFRIGFTSNVVNAGRDLGVDQHGVIPGISYYHKTGLFGSVSGYWNSQFEPKYNLTVLSAGYFGTLGTKMMYNVGYEHAIFANTSAIETDPLTIEIAEIIETNLQTEFENPLTENISTGIMVDFDKLYSGIDYSFFFGKETAHRFEWRITGDIKKKGLLGIDKISFNPSFSILLGNADIVSARFNDQATTEALDREQKAQIAWSIIRDLGDERLFRRLEPRQREVYLRQIVAPIAEEILLSIPQTSNAFGLMNYGFSVPLTFRERNWSYTMSYNYNIPVDLPGEKLDLSPSGYFALSLTYFLEF